MGGEGRRLLTNPIATAGASGGTTALSLGNVMTAGSHQLLVQKDKIMRAAEKRLQNLSKCSLHTALCLSLGFPVPAVSCDRKYEREQQVQGCCNVMMKINTTLLSSWHDPKHPNHWRKLKLGE